MAQVNYYNIFNDKVSEFFTDLSKAFPDVKEFSSFKTGLNLMKNLDVKKPQQIFDKYISTPYRDYFLKRNEDFFLTNQYDIWSEHVDYWQNFITKLRYIWKSLKDDNKDVIWKYFQVLVALNDKIISSA